MEDGTTQTTGGTSWTTITGDVLTSATITPQPYAYIDPEPEPQTLVAYGGEIKAMPDGKIGGLLVRFTDAKTPDLYGDFFTDTTNFGSMKRSPILWEHSLDPAVGDIELGHVELKKTDFGIWAEGKLQIRKEYEQFLEEEFGKGGKKAFLDFAIKQINDGRLGWSSGTLAHRVKRQDILDETTGKVIARHIRKWPLGLDASLTFTPAEPTNSVVPVKAYTPLGFFYNQDAEELETEQAEADPVQAAPTVGRKHLHLTIKWRTKK